MDLSAFDLPAYGLIDSDPLLFKQQFQAFYHALEQHQDLAGSLAQANAGLQLALESANTRAHEAESRAQQHQTALATLQAEHDVAVAAYRQAVLDGDPTLPPVMVEGTTIDGVNASLNKARDAVAYIREKVAAPGGAGLPGPITSAGLPPRVPAGAPGRTLPDIATMSARDKLVYGTSRLTGV